MREEGSSIVPWRRLVLLPEYRWAPRRCWSFLAVGQLLVLLLVLLQLMLMTRDD